MTIDGEERLGDVLSGQLADAEINSMEVIRMVRKRGQIRQMPASSEFTDLDDITGFSSAHLTPVMIEKN